MTPGWSSRSKHSPTRQALSERSLTIQVGSYELLSEMSSRSALQVLVNPDSLIKNPTVTIPEGLRAEEILASIAKQTDFSAKELQTAYDDTEALDLPAYANGDPEGYLFPSTYDLEEDTTAAGLLHEMVASSTDTAEHRSSSRTRPSSSGRARETSSRSQAWSRRSRGTADMQQGGERRLQPARHRHGAAVRLDPALRPRRCVATVSHDGGAAPDGLALQHLCRHRPPADTDQLAR